MTTYLSLPGDSPAASKALPATKSAPEKLLRTCQREKSGAGKKEDAGRADATKDNDAAGRQIALYTPWYYHITKLLNCKCPFCGGML